MADRIRDLLATLSTTVTDLTAEVNKVLPPPPPPPPSVVVKPGEDLQAALNAGGTVDLVAGAEYPGTFILKNNTVLRGNGARLPGKALGPALDVPPSTHDVRIENLEATTPWDQSVIRLGRNDGTQNAVALAPSRIAIDKVTIRGYRGKRGIEIDAGDVSVTNCLLNDIYDPAGRDSQAIWIGNSPGNIVLDHNDLSAGSENILVGGDTMKMPGIIPTNIVISNNRIWKPLAWQADGINRGVKNLIELKTGRHVVIKNNTLDGCWKQAQDGYALVVTPRAGGDIHDVLIEDNEATNVGAGLNILGQDVPTAPPTPSPLSGLVVRRLRLQASAKQFAGRGILALITGVPQDVVFDDVTGVYDGNAIIQMESPKTTAADGTVTYKKMGALTITNSRLSGGVYGLFFTGSVGGKNWQQYLDALTITGNTIADPSGGDGRASMHALFPNNTYMDAAAFAALVATL